MEPNYREGSYVITTKLLKPKINDVIVFKKNDKIFLKRIENKIHSKFYVVSDNKNGVNSKKLGLVKSNEILGKVILKI